MVKPLEGKLALITGSSRGIGLQITGGLVQLGCKVIVHGRSKQNLEKTFKELNRLNAEFDFVEGELTNPTDINRLSEIVLKKYGGIDILYNNAALMTNFNANIWEHTWENWEKTFQANVYAVYLLCSAFVPGMISKGYGRIINLSSGIKNTPELAPYGASKAAIDKLTEDLSVGLKNTGVRMNTLDPGWLKTDMGGENAEHPVEKVLPGALIPALIDSDGPNGEYFSAINYNRKIALKYNLDKIQPLTK
jgi:3-oxoacyl-[acyl-carrier protein] reductase